VGNSLIGITIINFAVNIGSLIVQDSVDVVVAVGKEVVEIAKPKKVK
jgi:hypothetical protein